MNLDLTEDMDVQFKISGPQKIELTQAKRLTASKVNDHNTFDEPNLVSPKEVSFKVDDTSFMVGVPARSINTLEFKLGGKIA